MNYVEYKKRMITILKDNIKFDNEIELINFLNLTEQENELVLKWRNSDVVRKNMITQKKITKNEHKRFINNLNNREDNFYWLFFKKKKPYGGVDILDVSFRNKHCSWGFYLNPIMIRSGIGLLLEYFMVKMVFDILGFHCLRCETLDTKKSVIKIHEFFGFKKEGLLRDFVWDSGTKRWEDILVMSILREEWNDRETEVETLVNRLL